MPSEKPPFHDVDLQAKKLDEQVLIYRHKVAEDLQGLVDSNEINPLMTIAEVISLLRK